MSLHHTDFAPLDRPVRRRGWIEIAALLACLLLGYVLSQAWHCLRYLAGRKP